MNENKRKLIAELRKNGRKKLTEISRELKIPVSTVFDTVRSLEKKDIIDHKTHLNFEKIGYPIQMMITIKTSEEKKKELGKYLIENQNVNSIFEINSDNHYMFEAFFKNHKGYHQFITELELEYPVKNKTAYSIIDTIKKEQMFTTTEHFEKFSEKAQEEI
jgi:DNA-binding Lrp family transcriptional regulator